MSTDLLEVLSARYESAEVQFLDLVRSGGTRDKLAQLAREVAVAAAAFNVEAYRKFHAGEEDAWMPLDQLTERTEVLEEIWHDIAAAYGDSH